MSLLTSLTWGAGACAVHARVRAAAPPRHGHLRLVVQAYEPSSKRPSASIQLAVTPDELQRGVSVSVPHDATMDDSRVVAWVESGAPDLADGGLHARPRRGSLVGGARGEDVCIDLRRE